MSCATLSMIVLCLIIVVIFLKLDVRRLERIHAARDESSS